MNFQAHLLPDELLNHEKIYTAQGELLSRIHTGIVAAILRTLTP